MILRCSVSGITVADTEPLRRFRAFRRPQDAVVFGQFCSLLTDDLQSSSGLFPNRIGRPVLRPFRESDYGDLSEFLSPPENDAFEGWIMHENGREHLRYRLGSEEFPAMELAASGKVIGSICCGNRDFRSGEVGYIVSRLCPQ